MKFNKEEKIKKARIVVGTKSDYNPVGTLDGSIRSKGICSKCNMDFIIYTVNDHPARMVGGNFKTLVKCESFGNCSEGPECDFEWWDERPHSLVAEIFDDIYKRDSGDKGE